MVILTRLGARDAVDAAKHGASDIGKDAVDTDTGVDADDTADTSLDGDAGMGCRFTSAHLFPIFLPIICPPLATLCIFAHFWPFFLRIFAHFFGQKQGKPKGEAACGQ